MTAQQSVDDVFQQIAEHDPSAHAMVLLYRAPDGTLHREACWWPDANPNHQTDPRTFMELNQRALARGLNAKVFGPEGT